MANLLKLTLRGTIVASQWALNMWVRKVSPATILDEAEQAQALTEAAALSWADNVNPILSGNVATNKFIAEGYDTPACYFELNTDILGLLAGQICPQFTAMGFRQFRTNSDFRVATHRVPGVRELNNSDGSWVYGDGIAVGNTATAEGFFSDLLSITLGAVTYEFQPVLIRTQYTPRGVPDPVTIFFDPPQMSDVPSAGFYGITSQVSRKRITPS